MSEFGDIELADVWDAEPTIAPEQVAYRLHELRVEVDALAGQETPPWADLDGDAREEALHTADIIVHWIAYREPDNPALTARRIHDARRRLSGHPIPAWGSLTNDQRQIAIDLMRLLIAWLERQGPR